MDRRRRAAGLIINLIFVMIRPCASMAQTPAGPPGVGALSGVIRDLAGAPLRDVEVTLLGESSAATRTDSSGRFALRDVPAGGHTALFRRIGYRSVDYRWVAQAGRELEVAVTMQTIPRQLERVIVEAPSSSRRRGTSSIAGTVTDSSGQPVSGADVRLLGSGLSTITDSSGRFDFAMLAAGSYIVRARRVGLASSTHVMQIANDDNRGITLKMFGLPPRTGRRDSASASGYGITDAGFDAFDRRERVGLAQSMLGPGDLFRADRAPLDFVLQPYRDTPSMRRPSSSFVREGPGSTEEGDCLLVDGRRAVYQPLRTFSSVSVQLVEVFRPNSFVDDYVASEMSGLPECRGDANHHPSYFVLWTRSLR